jgi:hypothetical protein
VGDNIYTKFGLSETELKINFAVLSEINFDLQPHYPKLFRLRADISMVKTHERLKDLYLPNLKCIHYCFSAFKRYFRL